MELIYIGEKFYFKSGTAMSSIYDIFGNRQDWGKVQIALQNGESVHIRPATEDEKKPYRERLQQLEDKRKEREDFENTAN